MPLKLIPVEELPVRKRRVRHELQELMDEFAKSDMKFAKVEWNGLDYKNSTTARSCLCNAAKRSGHPIVVIKRGEDIYLAKKV